MFLEAVEKAGINGIIAGVASAGYFGLNAQVAGLMTNQTIPLYVLAGSVGAIGSLVGDGAHILMKDAIPVSKKFNDQASVVTGLAINGVLFGAMLYCYQPDILNDFGVIQAFAMGAGAEVAGSALYTYLKENQYF